MKWCSNSLGSGNHLPLKIGALIVALLMVASCFVLVLDEAEAVEPAETVETTQERAAPPLGRIGFEPIVLPPFVPRPFLSLVMNEVRSTDELSYMIVFVNSTIYPGIDEELETYADDVERTGIGVKIITVNDADPEQIRNVILDSINDLEGCFLVGDLPTAWFEMTEDWGNGPEYTQFPCDLFYMDRNGVWTDSDNDGMYDVHSGDIQPEIWLGRYRTDNMQGDEVALLKEYFAKNHAYRTGELTFPNKALTYVDDDWQPGTEVSDAVGDAFSDNTVVYDRATTPRVELPGISGAARVQHRPCDVPWQPRGPRLQGAGPQRHHQVHRGAQWRHIRGATTSPTSTTTCCSTTCSCAPAPGSPPTITWPAGTCRAATPWWRSAPPRPAA